MHENTDDPYKHSRSRQSFSKSSSEDGLMTDRLANTSTAVNRNHKDGVFRTLFNHEDRLRELYSAIKDIDIDPDSEVKIRTLERALYMDIKNDLAFEIDGRFIIFIEHQSTICPNMPIRMTEYVGRIFEQMFGMEIYRDKPMQIPAPEFYVFYNGAKKAPKETIWRLSDCFAVPAEENSMELIVRQINIGYNENMEILKRNRTLYEYSRFVYLIEEFRKREPSLESTMERVIKQSLSEGILTDFLSKYATEVHSMLFTEVTREQYGELRQKDGIEIGEFRGGRLKIICQVRTKLKKGQSPEMIADALEEDVEEILPVIKALKDNGDASDEEVFQNIYGDVTDFFQLNKILESTKKSHPVSGIERS